jgi:hypothetical protein
MWWFRRRGKEVILMGFSEPPLQKEEISVAKLFDNIETN